MPSTSAIKTGYIPEILLSLGFRIYIQNIAVALRHHNNTSAAQFQMSNKLDSSLAQSKILCSAVSTMGASSN